MGAFFSDRFNPLCLPGDTVFTGKAGPIGLPGENPNPGQRINYSAP